MAGYILVLAILLLGGAIATIGDRLGTKVGKARLSLWGMRPRKTAVAITILTGGVISATTLGILFASSEQLRRGVFELGSIEKKLRKARGELEVTKGELEQTRTERQTVEKERDQARSEQVTAEKRLTETRKSLDESLKKQQQTQAQLSAVAERAIALRNEAQRLQQEQQALIRQRDGVIAQIQRRNQDIAARDRDIAQQEEQLGQQTGQIRQQEERLRRQDANIQQQQTEISERDQRIAAQRQVVAEGERRLQELEDTQRFLDDAIRQREKELLQIRQGSVVITRNEVLAVRIVRVLVPSASEQAINLLLQEANKRALEVIRPGINETKVPTIQITQAEVERLRREIEDGREYVVRILSAGNYVSGEEKILVFTDVVPNQVIFEKGSILATTSVTPDTMDAAQIQERISLLVEASQFRAQRAGLISERPIIGNDSVASLVQFYEKIQKANSFLSLQAVTAAPIYPAGPLRIELVALRNGETLFSTAEDENDE